MNRKAVFSEASIGTLHVSNLKVTGRHNISGTEILTRTILPPPPPQDGGDAGAYNLLLERLVQLETSVTELKTENEDLKKRLDTMTLNDLVDVELVDQVEDGSFLGFSADDNLWLPYPEVGQ